MSFPLNRSQIAIALFSILTLVSCSQFDDFVETDKVPTENLGSLQSTQVEPTPSASATPTPTPSPTPFGNNGNSDPNELMQVTATKVQVDGKVLVGGYKKNGANKVDFGILRLGLDGTRDTSFGTNGLVMKHFGFGDDFLQAISVTSEGKIIAVGWGEGQYNLDLAIVRFNADGSLDTSFGTQGVIFGDLVASELDDFGRAIKILPDGKILIAGDTHPNCKTFLARYSAAGALDATFGDNGVVQSSFNGGHDTFDAVEVVGQRIIAAGTLEQGEDFGVRAFLYDGAKDTSFGNSGKYILDLASKDQSKSVMIRSDGKIVVAGYSGSSSVKSFTLFQLTSAGALDTSWADNGIRRVKFNDNNTGSDKAYGALMLSDGSVIAAGQAAQGSQFAFGVIKLMASGSLDPAFGVGGKATHRESSASKEIAYALDKRGDKIVLGGNLIMSDDYKVRVKQISPTSGALTP